jgi:hypothetical protein
MAKMSKCVQHFSKKTPRKTQFLDLNVVGGVILNVSEVNVNHSGRNV